MMFLKLTLLVFFAVFLDNMVYCTAHRANNGDGEDTSEDYSYCGKGLPPSRKRVRRVIGGIEATKHAWPWQVLILNGTSLYCGGSIISPTWIITAAHCLDKPYDVNMYVGRHQVNASDVHEQKLDIERFYIHQEYIRGDGDSPGDYDIALVKLRHPIEFSSYVHPVCLPDENTRFEVGHQCILSGWGMTNTTTKEKANTLRQVEVPLISQEACNSKESYGGIINQRYFCAGAREGGKDGCSYDSGGPLVCSYGYNTWFLVGTMSWGSGCAQPYKYGVYFNITQVLGIIRKNVTDLPEPDLPTPKARTTTKDSGINNTTEDRKERLFIAIICVLCVIIVVLITTLCIVHFYTKGYICCTPTKKSVSQQMHKSKSPKLLGTNGKLNKEVAV